MKTPFTMKGRPQDVIERWTWIEDNMAAVEAAVFGFIRHVALGCSQCKQEDFLHFLVYERKLTTGEALMMMDLLMAHYLCSPGGRQEMAALNAGKDFYLPHNPAGKPVIEGSPNTAISVQELPAPVYDREVTTHKDAGGANAGVTVKASVEGRYQVTVAADGQGRQAGSLYCSFAESSRWSAVTPEAVLAILTDRLDVLIEQSSEGSFERHHARFHLESAMFYLQQAAKRAAAEHTDAT